MRLLLDESVPLPLLNLTEKPSQNPLRAASRVVEKPPHQAFFEDETCLPSRRRQAPSLSGFLLHPGDGTRNFKTASEPFML